MKFATLPTDIKMGNCARDRSLSLSVDRSKKTNAKSTHGGCGGSGMGYYLFRKPKAHRKDNLQKHRDGRSVADYPFSFIGSIIRFTWNIWGFLSRLVTVEDEEEEKKHQRRPGI